MLALQVGALVPEYSSVESPLYIVHAIEPTIHVTEVSVHQTL